MSEARRIIEQLDLAPHPEGGWYRETWRAPVDGDGRSTSTAIHFLLEAGQASHWHRVDATEIWLWHRGDPLQLRTAKDESGPVDSVILGPDIANGQRVQHVVAPDEWQAARPIPNGMAGYCLVSCVVAPGFEFSGFELAAPGWKPGTNP